VNDSQKRKGGVAQTLRLAREFYETPVIGNGRGTESGVFVGSHKRPFVRHKSAATPYPRLEWWALGFPRKGSLPTGRDLAGRPGAHQRIDPVGPQVRFAHVTQQPHTAVKGAEKFEPRFAPQRNTAGRAGGYLPLSMPP